MKISVLAIVLFVITALAGLLLSACEPGPEEKARAMQIAVTTEAIGTAAAIDNSFRATSAASDVQGTATSSASSVQATSTANAISAQATGDSNQWQATATAAAWSLSIQATQTAVPNQAQQNAVANSNATYRQWVVSIIGISGGSLALILALFAGAAWVRMRAKIIPRGPDGQLPGFVQGGALADPQRQLGVVQLPSVGAGDWAAWAIASIAARQLLPPPAGQVRQLDGGATAAEYLEIARSANAAATAQAVFGGATTQRAVAERIELLRKPGLAGLLGNRGGQEVRVTISKPTDQIRELIAGAFGVPPALLEDRTRTSDDTREGASRCAPTNAEIEFVEQE